MQGKRNLLITSFLEQEYVDRIRAVDERLNVIYEPELIAPPRYIADHNGEASFRRSAEQEDRWRRLLADAEILFDYDHTHPTALPELAPNVRWIQFTSSGIGVFVKKNRYAERMPRTLLTTASGVHAQPLAEFCLLVMLMFSRRLWHTLAMQQQRVWERFTGSDLRGKTLTIFGVGRVGRKVSEFAQAVGMHVIGIVRNASGRLPADLHVDELYSNSELNNVLPRTDFLVLIAPHTPETENLIGRQQLEAMPQGSVLINIARGQLVVEQDLIDSLRSGHLAGAGLDVFATEPLPADSPLWAMPNVLVSPHSASTSDRENELITDLFCENIRRYLNGQPLLNVLDPERMY
ncbi:MAG: D-2-hydroxyacid dehydrogenase [Bacillota bacterium]|jgi:glyoxylate/hydroxypyruvate reductase A